ncbi:amidase [Ignatzschineria indica]|uniref:Amidase n=1 Tax=Ignatzschineria indica TaxID=472583 RepID=A0A2U2AKA8_9GAMM|nr:amidase [Ignatzschineria indica]PWD83199.1 amidase [Ignatzschineria indica]GGZ82132.1 amidase [Ignatzschineria indica]
MTQILNSTLTAMTEQLERREITSVDLVSASFERIAEMGEVGALAFTKLYPQEAMEAARVADQRLMLGDRAPLLGLPISIKDSMDIAGEVTPAGSVIFTQNGAAEKDAPVIDAIKRAGAIIVGRTNMSEFAFSGLGVNPHYGTPVHPERSDYIAGGSTSGGAVSVASHAVFAALGSDTGGSLRIPAAFCDVVGFKPTASRISTEGVVPLSYSYDSVGAITRSVEDAIVMDQVLSQSDYKVPEIPLSQMRFFVTKDYVMEGLDAEVEARFLETLAQLERAGATIIYRDFYELSHIPNINSRGGLTAAEIWCEHELFFDQLRDQYDPLVAQRIERGRDISASHYLQVLKKRAELQAIAAEKLTFFDAWLMPTVAVQPPKVEDLADEAEFFRLNGIVLRNTTVTNFLDGCALSLPLGAGIGLSISGLKDQDHHILAVAKSIEKYLRSSL